MQRSIGRPNSYVPPVTHGLLPYARHYVGFVDFAQHYGLPEGLLIHFPALGGLHGHTIVAKGGADAYARARDLLILHGDDVLDDPYAWAADIELKWLGSGRPLRTE